MNVNLIKNRVSKAFSTLRGIPMSSEEYSDLKSYFDQLLRPWENCITEKCTMEPDERQERFRVLLEFLDEEFQEKSSINNCFFKASYVNVGWLKSTIEELLVKSEIRTIFDIRDYLISCVQRMNNFEYNKELDKKENAIGYYVTFTARDDYGEYGYGFFVKTTLDLKEK